jgi:uncharacterized membrane protein YGL010W
MGESRCEQIQVTLLESIMMDVGLMLSVYANPDLFQKSIATLLSRLIQVYILWILQFSCSDIGLSFI